MNAVNITSLVGKSTVGSTTTTDTVVLTAITGTTIKINSIFFSNVTLTNGAVTLKFNRGGTSVSILNSIVLPIGTTLTGVDKMSSIYLEPGDTLRVSSDVDNNINYLISYEEII